jgi:penicillin amidase
MRTQGEWPAKWKGQGDFVMPGTDKQYMWQGMIPQDETPAQYNPERGFVSSANQYPADSTYPYYLGRGYTPYRGIIINRMLARMSGVTHEDMMAMQTDNYNVFAEMAVPVLLKNIREQDLDAEGLTYLNLLKSWDFRNEIDSKAATVFSLLWNRFADTVYNDEYANAPSPINRPFESTLLESILKDSAYKFLDNIETPSKETLTDDVTAAFKSSLADFQKRGQGRKIGMG